MPTEITSRKLGQEVEYGFDRMRRFRLTRAMFIREYVGQYYRSTYGITNDEPINLLFNTISIFVPNLVMKNPTADITTDILPYAEIAELLGLSLDKLHDEINLKKILREWIVDAFFGLTVLKTGICATNSYYDIDSIMVDPGQIYTAHVDLDDFAFDAICSDISESSFYCNRIRVPRQILLDDKYIDHDLVMKLPSASKVSGEKRTEDITLKNTGRNAVSDMHDTVHAVEVWVPDAGAIALIPDPKEMKSDEFLKISDYYGPEKGPYTYLSLTPPVPGNPFPVPAVGIWYDLHIIANKIFKKTMNQADRQRDVLLYDPAHADEALDIMESGDGDTIAVTDPTKFQALSIGGQNEKNAGILSQLQVWFNYVSGNPDQMAGLSDAKSATQSDINQSNSTVRLSDMRDILYDQIGEVFKKESFYLMNDPLIELPLTKRMPGGELEQVVVTPELLEGDYLDYNYKVLAKSMSRLDPMVKSRRVAEFGTKVVPAMVNAAMICMNMGVEFNIQKSLTDLADEMEILDIVSDWFNDPEYMKKIERRMMINPQPQDKPGLTSSAGIMQNGGGINGNKISTPQQEVNSQQQQSAGAVQSDRRQNLEL